MKNSAMKSGMAGVPSIMFALILAFGGGLTLTGCEQQGPAEEAGENVDDAMEAAGDSMEDAADDIEDATD
tara:strand:- start:4270 stop:4479 length:210 start_codon:yes stop_codon:yes gene_type:complete